MKYIPLKYTLIFPLFLLIFSFVFRDVPECSGMFYVPDFIDGPLDVAKKYVETYFPSNAAARNLEEEVQKTLNSMEKI